MTLNLPQGFGIHANGTVLDAKFDEFNTGCVSYNGNTPPNVPETTANLWLRYDVTSRLQTRLGLRYVGRTFSDNANQFRVPGYAVVDGGISLAVTQNVAANVRVYERMIADYLQHGAGRRAEHCAALRLFADRRGARDDHG